MSDDNGKVVGPEVQKACEKVVEIVKDITAKECIRANTPLLSCVGLNCVAGLTLAAAQPMSVLIGKCPKQTDPKGCRSNNCCEQFLRRSTVESLRLSLLLTMFALDEAVPEFGETKDHAIAVNWNGQVLHQAVQAYKVLFPDSNLSKRILDIVLEAAKESGKESDQANALVVAALKKAAQELRNNQ